MGIPPDKLDFIFDEFAQLETDHGESYQGTGLGLPISRRLAELMGGRMEVASRVGEGTTFTPQPAPPEAGRRGPAKGDLTQRSVNPGPPPGPGGRPASEVGGHLLVGSSRATPGDVAGNCRFDAVVRGTDVSLSGVRKVYRGRDIEVSFDLDISVHIAECPRGQPQVFQLDRRPWTLPDMAPADEVAEIVRRCPTGALLYRRLDGEPDEDAGEPTTVTPVRDGPLLVKGKIEVRREDGTVEVLPRATLCRCGESEHKPFCDNRHLAVRFRAPGQPFRIHLSPVRPRLDQPISKAEDPRRDS